MVGYCVAWSLVQLDRVLPSSGVPWCSKQPQANSDSGWAYTQYYEESFLRV